MYQRGNYQGRNYHRLMNNHWQYSKIKTMIEYKAAWKGIPVIHLTKSETRGTSSICSMCGQSLQGSKDKTRQLWCKKFDRDLVAVMNISHRGWVRFAHSKGIGSESMVQESERRGGAANPESRSDEVIIYTGGRNVLGMILPR